MLLWEEDQITAVQDCLGRARAGRPTLIVVEGEPGSGKSSLLDELMLRASDFEIRVAAGLESDDSPTAFGTLRDWGVNLASGDSGARINPYAAAHLLRTRVDRWAEKAPVLLRLDDLQWADQESVEAVRWLLARAEGDRLLIAVGARPTLGRQAPEVLIDDPGDPRVRRVPLDGLSLPLAQRLVAVHRPGLSRSSARRLWEHTGGNPLYLTALLREFDETALSQTVGLLPAPAAFNMVIARRWARLSQATHRVLEAVAVLGSGFSSIFDVATVAKVEFPSPAVQEAVDAELLTFGKDHRLMVAPAHALVRAAVYQHIPVDRRRLMHLRAADLCSGSDQLDHSLAATDSYDDELAASLESLAHTLHDRSDFRRAEYYFDAAGAIASEAGSRERLRWEALWNGVLARRGDRAELPEGPQGHMAAEAGCVHALAELSAGEVHEALARLERLDETTIASASAMARYRIGVITAYTRMLAGASTARVDEALDLAGSAGERDPALHKLESPTRGYMAARKLGGSFGALFDELPDNPEDATLADVPLLVWRGLFRVSLLRPREAIGDLRRAVSISVEQDAPRSFHTYLGLAQWLLGAWPLARVSFTVGLEVFNATSGWAPEYEAALLHSTEGRAGDADLLLATALEQPAQVTWQEGRLNLLIALVVRCHAEGNPPRRVEEIRALYPDLDHLLDGIFPSDSLILMHLAMAAISTHRLDVAGRAIAMMRAETNAGPSLRPVVAWLRGLLAEARGDRSTAIPLLAQAAQDDANELPLFRAHMWSDLALVTEGHDPQGGGTCRAQAWEIYRSLGAMPYIERLQHQATSQPTAGTARLGADRDGYPMALTEREQDVLTLVVDGLSYAQISQQLFVTRSTVSYHLSNIYAKFSVRSRYELTAWVRAHPELLTTASRLPA